MSNIEKRIEILTKDELRETISRLTSEIIDKVNDASNLLFIFEGVWSLIGFPGLTSHHNFDKLKIFIAVFEIWICPSCGGSNEPPSNPIVNPGNTKG